MAHWPYSSCLRAMSRNTLCYGLAFGCTNRPLRRHVEEVVPKTPTIEQKPVNHARIELRVPEPTALTCPERLCRVVLWDLGDYNLGAMTSEHHHGTIMSHWAHAVVNGRACRSSPSGERSRVEDSGNPSQQLRKQFGASLRALRPLLAFLVDEARPACAQSAEYAEAVMTCSSRRLRTRRSVLGVTCQSTWKGISVIAANGTKSGASAANCLRDSSFTSWCTLG